MHQRCAQHLVGRTLGEEDDAVVFQRIAEGVGLARRKAGLIEGFQHGQKYKRSRATSRRRAPHVFADQCGVWAVTSASASRAAATVL